MLVRRWRDNLPRQRLLGSAMFSHEWTNGLISSLLARYDLLYILAEVNGYFIKMCLRQLWSLELSTIRLFQRQL